MAVFAVTFVVLIVEVVGGLASNSLALLADAGHMAKSRDFSRRQTLGWIGTWPLIQVAIVVPLLSLSMGLLVRSYVRTPDPAARTASGGRPSAECPAPPSASARSCCPS